MYYTYVVRYTYGGYGTYRAYRVALTIMIAIYGMNLSPDRGLYPLKYMYIAARSGNRLWIYDPVLLTAGRHQGGRRISAD